MFVAFDEFDLRRIHRGLVVWVYQVLYSFFSLSIVIVKQAVALFKRFFLQPLIPQFRISEHHYGKRYNASIILRPIKKLSNSTM